MDWCGFCQEIAFHPPTPFHVKASPQQQMVTRRVTQATVVLVGVNGRRKNFLRGISRGEKRTSVSTWVGLKFHCHASNHNWRQWYLHTSHKIRLNGNIIHASTKWIPKGNFHQQQTESKEHPEQRNRISNSISSGEVWLEKFDPTSKRSEGFVMCVLLCFFASWNHDHD